MSEEIAKGEEIEVLITHDRLTITERIAKIYVKRPRACYFFWWIVVVFLSLITFQQGYLDIGDINNADWLVTNSLDTELFDAMNDGLEQVIDSATEGITTPPRTQEFGFAAVQILLEWDDEEKEADIITRENIQALCKFQKTIITHPEYPLFCLTDEANGTETACKTNPNSDLVSQFYKTQAEVLECALIDSGDFATLKADFQASNSTAFFVNPDDKAAFGFPIKTRSEVAIGGPLGNDSHDGNKTFTEIASGDQGDQGSLYKPFFDDLEVDLLEGNNVEGNFFSSPYNIFGIPIGDDGAILRFHNFYWRTGQFEVLVSSDQLLVSAAAMVIGIIMYLHIWSLFITINGVFAIVFMIPLSVFIYTGLLGITYFTNVHIVALFLALGIGADDLFVMVDQFKASKKTWIHLRGIKSTEEAEKVNVYGTGDGKTEVYIARLAYAMMRASGAVFATSSTTFVAFMATGVSPVLPVSAFGYYAAIVVLMLFLYMTMLMVPSFIMLNELYFAGRPFCCACVRAKTNQDDTDNVDELDENGDLLGHSSCETRFFDNLYVPFMEKSTIVGGRKVSFVAWTFLLVLVAFGAVMAQFAFQLTTPAEDDEAFGPSHMFTGFLATYNAFSGGDSGFAAPHVVFGIKGIDRTGYNIWDPSEFRGTAIFDDSFSLFPKENQQFILDLCDSLDQLSCIPDGETKRLEGCRSEANILVTNVECTMRDFHIWHDVEKNFTGVDAIDLGESNPNLFLERLSLFTLEKERIGDVGIIDGELKFFRIQYKTSLKTFQPEQVKGPVLDLLDEFLEKESKDVPETLSSMYQTNIDFVWINTEQGIVEGLFSGLAISVPCAYLVMIISTMNIVLATFAILGIISIISFVLGIAQLLGWALGIGEAIAAVMTVGLSVDYTIHMGQAVSHAVVEGHKTSRERFEYAAHVMGPTVLAASLTTGLSSAIMFFTQLAFFTKMAVLIVVTIVGSVIYSLLFFMPCVLLLLTNDPHFGDLKYYFGCCRASKSKKASGTTAVSTAV